MESRFSRPGEVRISVERARPTILAGTCVITLRCDFSAESDRLEQDPTLSTLEKLAKALRVKVAELPEAAMVASVSRSLKRLVLRHG